MAIAYTAWPNAFVVLFRKLITVLPANLQARIVSQVGIGASGLESIKKARLLLGVVFTSVMQWGLLGIGAYIAIVALGVNAPLSAGFVALALTVAGVRCLPAPDSLALSNCALSSH